MLVLRVRNVAQALPQGLELLLRHGQREASRAGPVLVAPWPVTTVYERPTERVLHSAVRDANPFFHLVESLWMLAGRDDAALLNHFVSDFGPRFADAGVVHGAYGHRWRAALGFDQLDYVVARLRLNPHDRQCVLQMWDAYPPTRYLTNGGEADCGSDDLRGAWKDRPCNTHVYLRVRSVLPPTTDENSADNELRVVHGTDKVLDVTVCCRSNDAVWGAYGANAVHFSVLQEYLAARVGVGVGTYYQVSNNLHVYESELERLRGRVAKQFGRDDTDISNRGLTDNLRDYREYPVQPLVDDPTTFDEELRQLLAAYEHMTPSEDWALAAQHDMTCDFHNSFLSSTAWPSLMAHRCYKERVWGPCLDWLNQIMAADWRAAMTEWCDRRRK